MTKHQIGGRGEKERPLSSLDSAEERRTAYVRTACRNAYVSPQAPVANAATSSAALAVRREEQPWAPPIQNPRNSWMTQAPTAGLAPRPDQERCSPAPAQNRTTAPTKNPNHERQDPITVSPARKSTGGGSGRGSTQARSNPSWRCSCEVSAGSGTEQAATLARKVLSRRK